MNKILSFLKPTAKRIIIGLLIWAGLWIITFFGFYACVFGDCMRSGHWVSCCGSAMSAIGYFLYYYMRYFFPIIAYFVSCYVNSPHCCRKK